MDMDGMLSFVWKFVPPERPRATAKMQVKFEKYRHDPRQTFQQSRLLGGGQVGSEYAVVTAAAQALARLAEKGHVLAEKVENFADKVEGKYPSERTERRNQRETSDDEGRKSSKG